MYAYLAREGEATVQDVMGDLELAQGTAYSYVNRLVDADVVKVTHDEQPRQYAAREIDLTVTTTAGNRKYTITPALIDAVGRRETNSHGRSRSITPNRTFGSTVSVQDSLKHR